MRTMSRAMLMFVVAASLDVAPALAQNPGATAAPPSPGATAPQATLKIGDPAPPLDVQTWLQGEPIERLDDGKITVLDFWATWCVPCVRGFPAMSELADEFAPRGVRVVAVNVWEPEPGRVPVFMARRGDTMRFAVAVERVPDPPNGTKRSMEWSRRHGAVSQQWLAAAQVGGIPHAMVVGGDGRILWMGHPKVDNLREALEQIVRGTWDVDAAARAQEGKQQVRAVMAQIDAALASLDAARYASAQTDARALLTGTLKDNPEALGGVAQMILSSAPNVPQGVERDRDLARDLARRAVELTQEKDPAPLATLARAHAERGEWADAIAAQEKAVAAATDADYKAWLESTLEEYRKNAGTPR